VTSRGNYPVWRKGWPRNRFYLVNTRAGTTFWSVPVTTLREESFREGLHRPCFPFVFRDDVRQRSELSMGQVSRDGSRLRLYIPQDVEQPEVYDLIHVRRVGQMMMLGNSLVFLDEDGLRAKMLLIGGAEEKRGLKEWPREERQCFRHDARNGQKATCDVPFAKRAVISRRTSSWRRRRTCNGRPQEQPSASSARNCGRRPGFPNERGALRLRC